MAPGLAARLEAAAMIMLALAPEALARPSFQMS